jgi:hypothetical protein
MSSGHDPECRNSVVKWRGAGKMFRRPQRKTNGAKRYRDEAVEELFGACARSNGPDACSNGAERDFVGPAPHRVGDPDTARGSHTRRIGPVCCDDEADRLGDGLLERFDDPMGK